MAINPNEPFNLYNFRQTVGDPARPYFFKITIPEVGSDTIMTAMCRSTVLPERTLGEVSVPFQGVNMKLGGTPTYSDWTVNFMCDESHELRRIFLKWNSLIFDDGTGFAGHSNTYKSDKIGVAQLSRNGQAVARYGFVGAYPKQVGQIQLNHGSGNEFETFDVQFAYDYFIMVNQFGEQTNPGSLVRPTSSPKLGRGSPPAGGQWSTFKPT